MVYHRFATKTLNCAIIKKNISIVTLKGLPVVYNKFAKKFVFVYLLRL